MRIFWYIAILILTQRVWAGKGEGAAEEEEVSRRAQRKIPRDEGGDAEKGDGVSDEEAVGKRKSAQERGGEGGLGEREARSDDEPLRRSTRYSTRKEVSESSGKRKMKSKGRENNTPPNSPTSKRRNKALTKPLSGTICLETLQARTIEEWASYRPGDLRDACSVIGLHEGGSRQDLAVRLHELYTALLSRTPHANSGEVNLGAQSNQLPGGSSGQIQQAINIDDTYNYNAIIQNSDPAPVTSIISQNTNTLP